MLTEKVGKDEKKIKRDVIQWVLSLKSRNYTEYCLHQCVTNNRYQIIKFRILSRDLQVNQLILRTLYTSSLLKDMNKLIKINLMNL